MKKAVLCVDMGGVLIHYDPSPLKAYIRDGRQEQLFQIITEHDAGKLEFDEMFQRLNNNCFKEYVFYTDFLKACEKCIVGVNAPMFHSLRRLKESGRARLVLISDTDFFYFAQTALKFPEILELFMEGDRGQWALSYRLRALKKDKSPFIRASSDFGFSRSDACFVDDREENLKAAKNSGFKKDSLFLYKMDDPKNHIRFEKFLDKHFPA